MMAEHSLRLAGGTGRINDVRQIIRARRLPFRIRNLRKRGIEFDHTRGRSDPITQGGLSQQNVRTAVPQHKRQTGGRI